MEGFRFKLLTLFTNRLDEQKRFYTGLLLLPLIDEQSDSFTCAIGQSLITFKVREERTICHFAINIPSNLIMEARQWLNPAIAVLKDGDSDIVRFEGWNANALYFYDADGNIVEFIARQNLNILSDSPFSAYSLLEISEIGVPTKNIRGFFEGLNSGFRVPVYSGGFEYFCAAGSEHALFILVDQTQKKWFPTLHPALPCDFQLIIEQLGNEIFLSYRNGQLSFGA
ncbi:VOC family protein [Mangrovibacterium lignilyticum]|uniref:VOC family protein n=1 Tax=Mangrovibacterium lignilyticum TaxID=2668052 RepID=UPI0013D02B8F|nr:ring-cleaving dioxygenase [Mangrovibacterium lignilyticum]